MTSYVHKARIVALAGFLSMAVLAVSAGPAAARLVCPPGATNLTYCTNKPPDATTKSATDVGASTATLPGVVNGFGADVQYYFEYGKTQRYGHRTPTHTLAGCPSGVSNPRYCLCPPGTTNPQYCFTLGPANVSDALAGLAPNTRYHFRLVARNGNGMTFGVDRNFKTHVSLPIQSVHAPGSVRHSTGRQTNHFTVTVRLRSRATVTISLLFNGKVLDKFRDGSNVGTVDQRIKAPRKTSTHEIQVVAKANGVTQAATQAIRVF